MDSRKEYIHSQVGSKKARILEIGPLNRPLFEKREYPNVFTADIRSTEEVKQLYGHSNEYLSATGIQVDVDTIVDVDFVIKSSYAETFKNTPKFDYVVASHVLEHIPDLLGWFMDVASVLVPNGKILLVYPDKRYCFDRFRESSVFTQALQVHLGNDTALEQRVMDFQANVVEENDPSYWWCHYNSLDHLPDGEINIHTLGKNADDVHYWPFSPSAFLKFLLDMERAGFSNYICESFQDTSVDDQQFFVTLRKKREKEDMAAASHQLRMYFQEALQSRETVLQQALDKAEAMKQEAHRVYVELDKTYEALRNNSIQMGNYESERQKQLLQLEALVDREKKWLAEKTEQSIALAELRTAKDIWEKVALERKQELANMCSAFDKASTSISNVHTAVQEMLRQMEARDSLLAQQTVKEKQLLDKNDCLEQKLLDCIDGLVRLEAQATAEVEKRKLQQQRMSDLQQKIDKLETWLHQTLETLANNEMKTAADGELIAQQKQKMEELQQEIVVLKTQLSQAVDDAESKRLSLQQIQESYIWKLSHPLRRFENNNDRSKGDAK